ncbi:MAG TPA: cytidine deaminase [Clostridia bacterium]|nr:cytidine deaminase [Clostridia bacterium]
MDNEKLIALAEKAMENSYSPYSNFRVGAALLLKNGKVVTGCNIENSAYSPCICAERLAIFKAVSNGEKEFLKIAVIGGKNGGKADLCPPCGVCRQVMSEFCGGDFIILVREKDGSVTEKSLNELFPLPFVLNEQ